eukprot:GHVQ01002455.1.p1 GENE.GHVQ01002455.1~~GHVQ01002455.1.p1  ORF type:complete len:422 (-),score=51.18 GHVQ01002455.1:276-1541(-)
MSTMNGFCSHHVETKLDRVVNFAAGPCCLPVEILLEAQQDLLCYKQARMSVMEMSHRSKEFLSIFNETKHTLEEILGVPTNYKLIFMQGGATQQFSAVPLNLLGTQRAKASYVITGLGRGLFLLFSCWVALSAIPSFGVYPSILFFLNVGLRCVLCSSWSEKAFIEGLKYATATKAVDTLPSNYTEIPSETEWMVDADARYLHYCSNETIYGVEFKHTPNVSVPLVCDMSSNFCSKPVDIEKHHVIYAGVQKNLGPAGAAVVIVKDDYCQGKELDICPTICSYSITTKHDSMYNTPPCWTIYMIGLMAKYIKQKGGLRSIQELSEAKAKTLYDMIDNSDDYYSSPVKPQCRSNMNIPFRVGRCNELLEKKFLAGAEKSGLVNLGGHRSVGGCRASLYNGMTMEGVDRLTAFMKSFQDENHV